MFSKWKEAEAERKRYTISSPALLQWLIARVDEGICRNARCGCTKKAIWLGAICSIN